MSEVFPNLIPNYTFQFFSPCFSKNVLFWSDIFINYLKNSSHVLSDHQDPFSFPPIWILIDPGRLPLTPQIGAFQCWHFGLRNSIVRDCAVYSMCLAALRGFGQHSQLWQREMSPISGRCLLREGTHALLRARQLPKTKKHPFSNVNRAKAEKPCSLWGFFNL